MWNPRWLHGIGPDVRVAVRSLLHTPTVTAVAVLSLVLGIGANAAIFSLVNGLLLRRLPVPAPERLAIISTTGATTYRPAFTYATFDEIRKRRLFAGLGAFTTCCSQSTIAIDGTTELVYRQFFSGDFFDTLGLRASVGRLITPADDVVGGGPDGQVVVISDSLWRHRFGASAAVIGTPLNVDHAVLTIVGVLPPAFLGLEVGRAFDIAMPLRTQLELADLKTPYYDTYLQALNIVVRRRPEESVEAASAALRAAQPGIRTDSMPRNVSADYLKDPFVLESIAAGTSTLRQRFRRPLMLMLAVVALVLLVACVNVANLLLARYAARSHELSVRVALGASRWRVARQLLIDSLILSALGTAGGVLLAAPALRLLVAQLSIASAPVVLDLSPDWRVAVFAAAVLVATTLTFGVVPALRATRAAPIDALKTRAAGGRRGRGRFGDLTEGFVVAQVALSLVLVVAAGLFIRTFDQLAHVSLGFDRDRVLGVTVNARAVPASVREALYHRLVRATESVPGVARAGGSISPPLIGFLEGDFVVSAPGTLPPPEAERISQSNFVTPGFFSAYGIVIRAGRDIENRDTNGSQPVMLVNEAFARRFFPGRSAVGEVLSVTARLVSAGDFPVGQKTIVGVVGDSVYRSLRERPRPAIYFPLAQYGTALPHVNFYLAVHAAEPSSPALQRRIAAALTSENPDLTLRFQPVSSQVETALSEDRLVAVLSGFFGVLALLLAGLGLYGVTSYAVGRRRNELGIRMALGAAPGSVVRIVLRRVASLVGVGVMAGVLLTLWASRFVAALLYGLSPRDPATLIGAMLVLIGVAACAAALPAWKASRIDPATTLRQH